MYNSKISTAVQAGSGKRHLDTQAIGRREERWGRERFRSQEFSVLLGRDAEGG